MELRQVRYFLAVVEAGTIGRAATNLTIVPSAVSQQIARLERELGVTLFDRSRRALQLTRAGVDFVPAARALVEAEELARRAVTGRHVGRALRVGITSGMDARLYAALQRLRGVDEARSIETIALPATDRIEAITDGRLDLALLHGDHAPTGLATWQVRRDRLAVVVSSAHPLADRPTPVLADFEPYPLVMHRDAVGTAVTDVTVRRCRVAGFEPRLQSHASSGPFAILSASPDAWSVFYLDQAGLLDGAALGLRFIGVEDADFSVSLTLLAGPEHAAVGARFAEALGR